MCDPGIYQFFFVVFFDNDHAKYCALIFFHGLCIKHTANHADSYG